MVGRDDRQLERQGLPATGERLRHRRVLRLDPYQQFWFSTTDNTIDAVQHHVEGIVSNMDDYLRMRPSSSRTTAGHRVDAPWAARQAHGEAVVWITLEGYFWFPRTLMGFTKISLAFYDQPELIHQINQDLTDFNLRILDQVEEVCVPTFATIAEDMSYNNGPMISERLSTSSLRLLPADHPAAAGEDVITLVDTDGDVTIGAVALAGGMRGASRWNVRPAWTGGLAAAYPDVCLVGHFDKMVMDKGEEAIRQEFERLLPLMRSGGFIPSVDHQTPPHVTLDQYRLYRRLLDEYTAVGGQRDCPAHSWIPPNLSP